MKERSRAYLLVILVAVLAVLAPTRTLYAQAPTSEAAEVSLSGNDDSLRVTLDPVWTKATLQGWEQGIRLALMNRRNTATGFITDRGVFQPYTPLMDDEYGLDLFSIRTTPQEDYLWFRSENGFRTSFGSINALQFATLAEFKSSVQITKSQRHKIMIQGIQQDDLRADRLFLNFGYQFNVWRNHSVGIQHNLESYKPDLDLNLYYMYGNEQTGMVRVDYSRLDHVNNFIFQDLGLFVEFADTVREYQKRPDLYQLKAISPVFFKHFRAEAYIGHQTRSEAKIGSKTALRDDYRHSETTSYAGALLEFGKDYLTLGAIFQGTIAEFERDTVGLSIFRAIYDGKQTERRVGLYALVTARNIRWDTWIWSSRFTDEQTGTQYDLNAAIQDDLDYTERRLMIRNRVQMRPQYRGLIMGLEHAADIRRANNAADLERIRLYSPSIHDRNSRVTALIGYQFHPRAAFTAGASYDIDNDLHFDPDGARFDNAFGRIEIRW